MLIAAASALGAAGVWLIAVCWRRGSVLGLLCGTLGSIAAVAAAANAGTRGATELLIGSLAAIVIGTALLVLSQAIERLLDQEPEGGAGDGWRARGSEEADAAPTRLRGRARRSRSAAD